MLKEKSANLGKQKTKLFGIVQHFSTTCVFPFDCNDKKITSHILMLQTPRDGKILFVTSAFNPLI